MLLKKITLFILIGLFLSPVILFAQNYQSDLPAGTSIHLLDNGLQVLLIENSAFPMVGVNVVVKTGSAYETFASGGMSHR